MMDLPTLPVDTHDPTNAAILAISEDKVRGFQPDPMGAIAARSGIDVGTVKERIAAMVRGGTIRRVRQTLMATNLARGALVAWAVPEDKLAAAFDWLFQRDPFSGHVVIRSTDAAIAGARYRLWTTLKVPQGYSLAKHCDYLCTQTGATDYRLMPAKRLFALGVGHVRRRGMEPGSKADELADVTDTEIVDLDEMDWRVLTAVKREFTPDELLADDLWAARADEAGVPLPQFFFGRRRQPERPGRGRPVQHVPGACQATEKPASR